MLLSITCALALLTPLITASYVLQDDYEASSFADMFDFFTGADPTEGYVTYVDQTTAQNDGLFSTQNGVVYMGVDATNVASGSGRNSIRMASKNSYNHGLIILDLEHMPGGQCGSWPAFWMLGSGTWPDNGEIDIIEGVNSQPDNLMTLHTDAGCSITNSGSMSGSIVTSNCDVNAPNQAANQGCAIDTSNTATFGSGFNQVGGGVYATEWTSEAINIYFFPRSAIPADILNGSPDPTGWGLPLSQFAGGCDIDEHVKDMQIVFDITFCGDWAGAVWDTDPVCSPQASTCVDFVQNNPSAFAQTYWEVNSLKVYQDNGAAATTSASTTSAVFTSATSSTTSFTNSVTNTFTTSALSQTTSTTPSVTYTTYTIYTTYTSSALPTTYSYPTTFSTFTGSFPSPSFSASTSLLTVYTVQPNSATTLVPSSTSSLASEIVPTTFSTFTSFSTDVIPQTTQPPAPVSFTPDIPSQQAQPTTAPAAPVAPSNQGPYGGQPGQSNNFGGNQHYGGGPGGRV